MDNNINSSLEQIKQLGELYKQGILTREEFEEQKRRILTEQSSFQIQEASQGDSSEAQQSYGESGSEELNGENPNDNNKWNKKRVILILGIVAVVIAAAIAIPLGVVHHRENKLKRLAELARLDSIQQEEARLEAEMRIDSINFENNRLRPTHFIERLSTKNYGFIEDGIDANLQSIGFIKGKTSQRYEANESDCEDYNMYQTEFKRDSKEGKSRINVTEFSVIWGGFGTSEFYISIDFENERAKNSFISDLLKMNFVYQNEKISQINIGDFGQGGPDFLGFPQKITVNYSEPLNIIIYSDYALKFYRKQNKSKIS